MSVTRFTFYTRKNGSLADADAAPTFNDGTDTYSIVRTDTGANVAGVAVGTALTWTATGTYIYDLTDPAYDLTYRAYLSSVMDGAPFLFNKTKAGTATPTADADADLTFLELIEELSQLKYATRSPSVAQKAECKILVNRGYQQFLRERNWSFLTPTGSLILWPTQTGTTSGVPAAAGGSTTVTSAATMFYPSMIGTTLDFTVSGNSYTITAYTSPTVVIVTGDASGEGDAAAMSVTATGDYRLPADFGGLANIGLFYSSGSAALAKLAPSSSHAIRSSRSVEGQTAQYPNEYAIEAVSHVVGTGQRWQLCVWPTPAALATLYYRYRRRTANLDADSDLPLGGELHHLTILHSVHLWNERVTGLTNGPWYEAYHGNPRAGIEGSLAASKRLDAEIGPHNLGTNDDDSDAPQGRGYNVGLLNTDAYGH